MSSDSTAGADQRMNDVSPSWRDRIAAVRYVPNFLQLVWQSHRGYTTAMVALRVARAFVPLGTLFVGKLIIDTVVAAVRGAPNLEVLWRYVALEMGIVVLGDVLGRCSALVESLLGDLFSNRISVRIMEHAATLDLERFEDPVFYDQLERARMESSGRIGLLAQLLAIGQDLITLVTLGTALLTYSPWLALLLAVAVLPSFLGETHFATLAYSLLFRYTPQRRELGYLRYVGASGDTAQELQMFGLASWLTERYRTLAQRYYEDNRRLSIRRAVAASFLSLFGTGAYYSAYSLIIVAALHGTVSIGQLTFLIASFGRSRDLIQRLLLAASDVHEQSLYLRDLFTFLQTRPRLRSRARSRPVPNPIEDGFVFEDVGFRYAGADRWAVRHVNFCLRPGERLALVGENGAGKTTLTKLLARLYDPIEGRITLDGLDLREYDLSSLREGIGVIFQDFVRYEMRFDENIGVGAIRGTREYLEAARTAFLNTVNGRQGRCRSPSSCVDPRRCGEVPCPHAAAPLSYGLPSNARSAIRRWRRSLWRRMAASRPRKSVRARWRSTGPGRAHCGAGRPRRVRGLPTVRRADPRSDDRTD